MKKICKMAALLALAFVVQSTLSSSFAATIGYWRFESGNVAGDSGPNGISLSGSASSTAVTPISYGLPASGVGSTFPTTIAQTGAANGSAIKGPGTGDVFGVADGHVSIYRAADVSAFTITSGISVEAFINPTVANKAQVIATQGSNMSGGSWAFGMNSLGYLFFQFMNDTGTWGQAGLFSNYNTGIALTAGHDYYVAYTMTLATTGTAGASFYFKDLTAGTALQTVNVAHVGTTMFDTTATFNIGTASDSALGFSGVIDEVRLSDARLAQSELLISVPEPSTYALMVLGVFVLLAGSRRKLSLR